MRISYAIEAYETSAVLQGHGCGQHFVSLVSHVPIHGIPPRMERDAPPHVDFYLKPIDCVAVSSAVSPNMKCYNISLDTK